MRQESHHEVRDRRCSCAYRRPIPVLRSHHRPPPDGEAAQPAKCPVKGVKRYSANVLVGYARVSTIEQDLTAQREGLRALGVDESNIHVDHGLTGTSRARPGLREALAAVRSGDTLVVTKLARLARSLPDARISPMNSPGRASPSVSAAASTTHPIRSGGCCSTCSEWWLSSRQT